MRPARLMTRPWDAPRCASDWSRPVPGVPAPRPAQRGAPVWLARPSLARTSRSVSQALGQRPTSAVRQVAGAGPGNGSRKLTDLWGMGDGLSACCSVTRANRRDVRAKALGLVLRPRSLRSRPKLGAWGLGLKTTRERVGLEGMEKGAPEPMRGESPAGEGEGLRLPPGERRALLRRIAVEHRYEAELDRKAGFSRAYKRGSRRKSESGRSAKRALSERDRNP
jgi:hypothetical protein